MGGRVTAPPRRVLVAGLGISGRAARDALARTAEVITLDAREPGADHHDLAEIDLARLDLVVASPGWAPTTPLLTAAAERGLPVWSEVELAWRLRADRSDGRGPAPWLAVTGTNGKTTTVTMLAAILTAAGLRAPAVGNVGAPVTAAATDPANDVLAVELSSFQLHHTSSMAPRAAAVLNLAPDHLDWHGSLEAYAAAKERIYAGVEVACVYPVADPRIEAMVARADVAEGARAVGVTLGAPGPGQIGLIDDVVADRSFHLPLDHPDRRGSAAELFTLADLAHLAGPAGVAPHLLLDAMTAAALARAEGAPARAVRDGLRAVVPGEHRVTAVGEIGAVRFVDDSKATNAHAAAAALAAFPAGSVVWVAGGLAKGATFDDLVRERADRLRGVVLIGTDPEPIAGALARHAPEVPVIRIEATETGTVMTRAVQQAHRLARPGDTVLLAPACASMDQFTDYADRGHAFRAAVAGLGGR